MCLRWGIVSSFTGYHGDLPYTMESALLFHYADLSAKGKPIPTVDRRAQYPQGLEVKKELSLGKGIAAAALYKAVGRPAPFRDFVRRFDAAWFCLGILAAFLVVVEMGGGHVGALMAAAFYALSVPSVARSTGMEFSRENFALPLIFLHWWFLLRARRQGKLLVYSIPAGVLLAVAAATWDVTQLYILLIGALAALGLLFGKGDFNLVRRFLPGMPFLAVAGFAVPYLIDHQFLFSWGMLMWYSLAAALLATACCRKRRPALPAFVLLAVFASLACFVLSRTTYPGTYSHFARLFLAKLRYFNVKPLDPAKLTYEARILWTPALHSATSSYLGSHPISDFTLLFLIGSAPLALLIRSWFQGKAADDDKAFLYWLAVFFLLYLLFVRMQVFLAFFVACLIGLGLRLFTSLTPRRKPRALVTGAWFLFVMLGLLGQLQAYNFLSEATAYYRGQPITPLSFRGVYKVARTGNPYRANQELVNWLRNNTEKNAVVLAGFTLESTIFADAERAIVLHPKFESEEMRSKVRQYLEALFSDNEKDFHDFCIQHEVDYYVLHPGVFAGDLYGSWIYSNRYMVDRSERRPQYASLAMRDNPERLQYLKKVTDVCLKGDRFGFFYRVFKVVSGDDMQTAKQHVRNARQALGSAADADRESLDRAEKELVRAIELFPGAAEAHSLLGTVYLLKGERNKASVEIQRWKQILADRQS